MAEKEAKVNSTVILISDGKGNIFIRDSFNEDLEFLSSYTTKTNLVVVNTENRNKSIGILEDIAKTFNAPHFYLEEII